MRSAPPIGRMAIPPLSPWVKRLLIANAVVFAGMLAVGWPAASELLAFDPSVIMRRPWGVVTYMFAHVSFGHLLLNMLVVFFFGPALESKWGSPLFIRFFLLCGLGGALLSMAFEGVRLVGASAACYGLMVGFAMYWPNMPIYVMGIFPVRAKWVVAALAAISFFNSWGLGGDGVSHFAHLGGLATGFLLIRSGWWGKAQARSSFDVGPGTAAPGGAQGIRIVARRWRRKAKGAGARRVRVFRPGEERRSVRESRRSGRGRAHSPPSEARLDRILDKVSREGIASLTRSERADLEEAARKNRAD